MSVQPIREKWKSTMTDRQRFLAQMHHRPFDRTMNIEFGYWKENFEQWPIFRDNGIMNNGQADIFFNFDVTGSVGMALTKACTWLSPAFEQKIIEERENTIVMRNADGLIGEMPKDGHSTIPHFTESSIQTPSDWEAVKAERFRLDDPARVVDIEAVKAKHPDDREYPLAVWTGSLIGKVRDMLTVEGLAYAICDYPSMVEDMVETATQLAEQHLDQLLPHVRFDSGHGWEDITCNTGPLIPMWFFNDVLLPRYARIGEKLRAHGVDLWSIDSDGDVRAFIPGWLEAGVNIMFPWEVNGCGHPGPALDQYGPSLRISGGVDKMKMREGKQAIRDYLESLVPYVQRGGFIPHCDHRCPPDVTPENYLYYLDVKEKLFGLD